MVKMSLSPELIRVIDSECISRYNKRLEIYGNDPRSLGWDTYDNQLTRFKVAASLIDLNKKEILDIGCGFGDFYEFLRKENIYPSKYTGIDINEKLLELARSKSTSLQFECRNLLLDPYKEPVCDIGIMLGLLNYRLREINNYDYAKEMIKVAFQVCREALIVDMLSNKLTPAYPKEDFVFYYDPSIILSFALTLTPYVVLKHDYPPIPQREFMLLLLKG